MALKQQFRKIQKILVANRGEIALRVIHSAKEMGIRTAIVYSQADADSLPVQMADESYPLQGVEVSETYLDQDQILHWAREARVDALHPGYGFLSENAGFAERCAQAGVVFIGPAAETIRVLGDKVASKRLAREAQVPVLPGFDGDLPQGAALQKIAEKIGFPILVKASAGGGGKGMRVVHDAAQLEDAVAVAEREGLAYFGNKKVFLEKYVTQPRHVEVQILGDHHGQVVHLFERECSIQRRHQKMIEESPSPSISPQTREALGAAAVRLAQHTGYANAGTVEFLLDPEDRFYFLEVNTRLQVEHPVTEWVTGVDLVKAQIQIAEGQAVPFTQESLQQRGHAIECRLYAEDPERDFLPSEGVAGVLREPHRPGVRIDSALREGQAIQSLYDPMLAKLTVYASSRREALIKMEALLRDYVLLGVRHNLDFLRFLLSCEPFAQGHYHTHTVQEWMGAFLEKRKSPSVLPGELWVGACLGKKVSGAPVRARSVGGDVEDRSLESLKGFRNVGSL